jgi:hypothetical protein
LEDPNRVVLGLAASQQCFSLTPIQHQSGSSIFLSQEINTSHQPAERDPWPAPAAAGVGEARPITIVIVVSAVVVIVAAATVILIGRRWWSMPVLELNEA